MSGCKHISLERGLKRAYHQPPLHKNPGCKHISLERGLKPVAPVSGAYTSPLRCKHISLERGLKLIKSLSSSTHTQRCKHISLERGLKPADADQVRCPSDLSCKHTSLERGLKQYILKKCLLSSHSWLQTHQPRKGIETRPPSLPQLPLLSMVANTSASKGD